MSSSEYSSRTHARGAMLLSSSAELMEADMPEECVGKEEGILAPANPILHCIDRTAETRILVVEDERIVGLHLKQQLVKLGYKVVGVCSSGEEALRVVSERSPDVVLMDIHIDGEMDGIETARQMPADRCLPVIYLTAFAGEETLQRARSTKPYGYMMKPFAERELHATIQMALERAQEDQQARDRESRLLLALGLASGNSLWC
ncbi:MAG TPA: response regulator [Acidisarcina sp.]